MGSRGSATQHTGLQRLELVVIVADITGQADWRRIGTCRLSDSSRRQLARCRRIYDIAPFEGFFGIFHDHSVTSPLAESYGEYLLR